MGTYRKGCRLDLRRNLGSGPGFLPRWFYRNREGQRKDKRGLPGLLEVQTSVALQPEFAQLVPERILGGSGGKER